MLQIILTLYACDRVRSPIREAAGRYGDLRCGSKLLCRADALIEPNWFSRSRSLRSFCPFKVPVSYTLRFLRLQVLSSKPLCNSDLRRISKALLFGEHCQDGACHFICHAIARAALAFSPAFSPTTILDGSFSDPASSIAS